MKIRTLRTYAHKMFICDQFLAQSSVATEICVVALVNAKNCLSVHGREKLELRHQVVGNGTTPVNSRFIILRNSRKK